MTVYLAAYKSFEKHHTGKTDDIWLLSSFFEHKDGKFGDYVYQEKHILDSGAFSTFKNPEKAKSYDWDNYVKKYIQFINYTGQKRFFEMDIDCVVGLEKVEYYRKQIEDGVGIQPIPCWHASRGWEYFEMMCEEYPVVSLGITPRTKQGALSRKKPEVLKKFIDTAHKKGKKIHGLGFTQTQLLKRLNFDSVDSTSWLSGATYGKIWLFDGNKMTMYSPPKGKRAIDYKTVNVHNFNEWVKFQKYAEKYL